MENHQENQAKRRGKETQESDGSGSPMSNIPAERKEHVCPVCSRRFTSGKALGGHVSAHVQARKVKNRFILEEVEEEEEEDDGEEIQEDDDDQISVCFICEKRFPSKKSLYGHMRSHPDRAWRGMGRRRRPPPLPAEEIQEEEEEESVHQAVVDLQGCLKHWGATDKRGRKKQMHNAAPLRHLLDAVDKERRIRRGGGGGDTKINQKKKINGDSASSRGLMKGKAHVSENPRFGRFERSSSCSSEDTDEYYCKDHMEEMRINGGILNPKEIHRKNTTTTSYHTKKSLTAESNNTNKKKRELELESAAEEQNKVRRKCSTCGKGFSSLQALGKHKKTQHKVKTEIHSTSNDGLDDDNQSIGGGGGAAAVNSNGATGMPPAGVHRQAAASPEIPTAPRIRRVLRIDLNEMPDNSANGST